MKRLVVATLLVATLVSQGEASDLAGVFARWRAECDQYIAKHGLSWSSNLDLLARDCVQRAEWAGFPYTDLAAGYANARAEAQARIRDGAPSTDALAPLNALEQSLATEISRRQEAGTANQLMTIEMMQRAHEAEQQRQEIGHRVPRPAQPSYQRSYPNPNPNKPYSSPQQRSNPNNTYNPYRSPYQQDPRNPYASPQPPPAPNRKELCPNRNAGSPLNPYDRCGRSPEDPESPGLNPYSRTGRSPKANPESPGFNPYSRTGR